MEYQNIINLLGNISDKVLKCITKNRLKFMINQEERTILANK